MDALGISQAFISGPNHITAEWRDRAPHRFIASWVPDTIFHNPDEKAKEFIEVIDNQGFRGL